MNVMKVMRKEEDEEEVREEEGNVVDLEGRDEVGVE